MDGLRTPDDLKRLFEDGELQKKLVIATRKAIASTRWQGPPPDAGFLVSKAYVLTHKKLSAGKGALIEKPWEYLLGILLSGDRRQNVPSIVEQFRREDSRRHHREGQRVVDDSIALAESPEDQRSRGQVHCADPRPPDSGYQNRVCEQILAIVEQLAIDQRQQGPGKSEGTAFRFYVLQVVSEGMTQSEAYRATAERFEHVSSDKTYYAWFARCMAAVRSALLRTGLSLD